MNTKQKVIVAILGVLFVMSLAANATFVAQWQKMKSMQTEKSTEMSPQPIASDFICKNLNFNNKQINEYQNLKQEFSAQSQWIMDSLHQQRKQLLTHLTDASPDSNLLYSIADSIGMYHSKLKKATIHHFFDVKQMCDNEQITQLTQIYSAILVMEESNHKICVGKGRGKRKECKNGRE